MSRYDDPRTHQFDPRYTRRGFNQLSPNCFTCHQPKVKHQKPLFVAIAQTNGRARVYWDGAYIGDVCTSGTDARKTWVFFRPGDNHYPGFYLPSRREAVDWLLGH